MRTTSYTFEAPAYWASALINGDTSSFSDDDSAEFDKWVETRPAEAREVVSCDGEPYFGRWNGLQTELLEYQALHVDDSRSESTVPDILDAPSLEHQDLIVRTVEAGTYTTTVLLGLASWLRGLEDEKGAELMTEFARRFAEYELTTI